MPKLTDEYVELTRRVGKRDGGRCRCCKGRIGLSAHHMVFRSLGGEDVIENIVTLCVSCHDAVHKTKKLKIVLPANANEEIHFHWRRGNTWTEKPIRSLPIRNEVNLDGV